MSDPTPKAAVLLAGLSLLLAACAAGAGAPCSPSTGCAAGNTCVAAACRPDGEVPSPADAKRVVLEPVDAAVIASRGPDGARPTAFSFGRGNAGTVELLLRFAAPWKDDAEVTSAFVVLEPVEGAPAAATPAQVSAAAVLEPWSSDSVTWGRQPKLSGMEGTTFVRSHPKTHVRIDVTTVVRGWGKRGRSDYGVAVVAVGADAFGSIFAFGSAAGQGPRLEAYVR